MAETDGNKWLGCLVCGEPVQVRLADDVAVLMCPACARQFVIKRQPLGGSVEVNGKDVPPFMAVYIRE